ncbi:MAG: hypothetical protein ACR2I2_22140 [Bryobacteraceae bacterium]
MGVVDDEVVYFLEVKDARFDGLERRIESIEQRIGKLQDRADNERIIRIEGQIPDRLSERISALEEHRDHKPHWFMRALTVTALTGFLVYQGWLGIAMTGMKTQLAQVISIIAPDQLKEFLKIRLYPTTKKRLFG